MICCSLPPESLCRVASIGRVSSIKRLISEGCDVSEPNSEGYTPIWLSVLHNHPLCVHALMRGGSDLRATNFKVESDSKHVL